MLARGAAPPCNGSWSSLRRWTVGLKRSPSRSDVTSGETGAVRARRAGHTTDAVPHQQPSNKTGDRHVRYDRNAGRRRGDSSVQAPLLAVPSYETEVKPLFREHDRKAMLAVFDLWSYDDVKANAEAILEQLAGGTMPCDGAWPGEQVELFRAWLADGAPA
jgi:hypothetical protein